MNQILITFIDLVSQNNLGEIKYYLELFLMKLVINKDSEQIMTASILDIFTLKL